MEAAITAVTTGVDYSPVIAGMGTVGAAVAPVYIAFKGIKMILAAVRGA